MQITVPNEILLAEAGELLAEGKDVELMPKGVSMLPFIVGDRDSVVLRKDDDLRPLVAGDIVLARMNGPVYVLHRIVRIGEGRIVLKGDGNLNATETVEPGDVLGRVISVVHPSGRSHKPGGAFVWRHSGTLLRRLVLGVYKRTVYKLLMNR